MNSNYFFMCLECSHQSLYWNECPASCPVCGASGRDISCISNESLLKALRENVIAKLEATPTNTSDILSPLAEIKNRLEKVEQAQESSSVWEAFRIGVGQWAAAHAMETLMGGLAVAIAFLVMLLQ